MEARRRRLGGWAGRGLRDRGGGHRHSAAPRPRTAPHSGRPDVSGPSGTRPRRPSGTRPRRPRGSAVERCSCAPSLGPVRPTRNGPSPKPCRRTPSLPQRPRGPSRDAVRARPPWVRPADTGGAPCPEEPPSGTVGSRQPHLPVPGRVGARTFPGSSEGATSVWRSPL